MPYRFLCNDVQSEDLHHCMGRPGHATRRHAVTLPQTGLHSGHLLRLIQEMNHFFHTGPLSTYEPADVVHFKPTKGMIRLTVNGPESPVLSKAGMNGPTFRGVMGVGSALALPQFAKTVEPPPYLRCTRTTPEYGQSLAYLAE